jgi:hypothetical protein
VSRSSQREIEDTTLYEPTVQGTTYSGELTFVDSLQEFSTRDVLSCTGLIDYYQTKKPTDILDPSIAYYKAYYERLNETF